MSAAEGLASWAATYEPSQEDLALADRSLKDTVAVALASRYEPIHAALHAHGPRGTLGEAGRWAVAAHVLDFDDLHMPTTTHVSAVCVSAALATGTGARGYLVGAGVMVRLGALLGWQHYAAGWHATTTSGALAAAAVGAVAHGLDVDATARALAFAVPAAGGVQRSFGSDAKSVQVGLAVDAGLRAADLAAAGLGAAPDAVDTWISLLGGDRAHQAGRAEPGPAAVPGGLAIKIFPCCYALQRPIAAAASLRADVDVDAVERIRVRAPVGTTTPLIHRRPLTGLQAKFSLEYAVVAALLDDHTGFTSFTDEAVRRPEAQRLVELVEVDLSSGGDWLLAGSTEVEIADRSRPGTVHHATLELPPGSPGRPPTDAELRRKLDDCLDGLAVEPGDLTWPGAADLLRAHLAPRSEAGHGRTS